MESSDSLAVNLDNLDQNRSNGSKLCCRCWLATSRAKITEGVSEYFNAMKSKLRLMWNCSLHPYTVSSPLNICIGTVSKKQRLSLLFVVS